MFENFWETYFKSTVLEFQIDLVCEVKYYYYWSCFLIRTNLQEFSIMSPCDTFTATGLPVLNWKRISLWYATSLPCYAPKSETQFFKNICQDTKGLEVLGFDVPVYMLSCLFTCSSCACTHAPPWSPRTGWGWVLSRLIRREISRYRCGRPCTPWQLL